MNIWDIILLIIIVAAVCLAAGHIVRAKKQGKSACGCDCGHCGSPCRSKQEKN